MKFWKHYSDIRGQNTIRTFIISGGRRTGTTLLTSIMCSSPKANTLGQEAQILTRIVESYKWSIDNFHDFGESFFPNEKSLTILFKEHVSNYIKQVSKHASPGRVIVLKNPEISFVIEYLYTLLPDAQYLATIRDPRDQIAAELEVVERRRVLQKKSNLQTRNIESLVQLYKSYLEGLLSFKRKYPDKLSIVRYEDLVQHPEKTISHLESVTKLRIPFDPGVEWPRVSSLAGLDTVSPSSSVLYGKPISDSSVGRYKRDLKDDEISSIETAFRQFIRQFGY